MKTPIPPASNAKVEGGSPSSMDNNEPETSHDEGQLQQSFNDVSESEQTNFDDTHEMDVLNEIYNLSDRIVASSLQCRSYDTNSTRKRLTYSDIQAKGSDVLDEAKQLLTDLERNIERRYLKHPFVRKYEINLSSLNRINQNSTYHHTVENSTNEIVSSSKYDEVPQQLERWRRTVNESRTPAQLALCLTQLERCIAWERSIMRVYCEICNSDVDEEKLLLCDGCDHGTHTYCFLPPMSFIPPNDWYCYVCIGKAKGENLCFVCGNKGDSPLNRCEHCSKLFHEDCLKNAKQQRGKWLCVLCAANDSSALLATLTAGNTNGKWVSKKSERRDHRIHFILFLCSKRVVRHLVPLIHPPMRRIALHRRRKRVNRRSARRPRRTEIRRRMLRLRIVRVRTAIASRNLVPIRRFSKKHIRTRHTPIRRRWVAFKNRHRCSRRWTTLIWTMIFLRRRWVARQLMARRNQRENRRTMTTMISKLAGKSSFVSRWPVQRCLL